MEYRHIKIPVQHISDSDAEKIKAFLLAQPKWRMLKDGEGANDFKRYAKEGVSQHYLWMAHNQAESWDDFITVWGTHDSPYRTKADRKHLIMPGELFLCDSVGGELWICRLEHPKRNGRTHAVNLYQITDDMNRDFGNCFNGYAILPRIEMESL